MDEALPRSQKWAPTNARLWRQSTPGAGMLLRSWQGSSTSCGFGRRASALRGRSQHHKHGFESRPGHQLERFEHPCREDTTMPVSSCQPVSAQLTGKIRRVRVAGMRTKLRSTEIADTFREIRGYASYREIEALSGVNREAWRLIELRESYEPGPDILLRASQVPHAPAYVELLEMLERDRQRIFEGLYRSRAHLRRSEQIERKKEVRPRRRSANGRSSRRTTASA